MPITGSVSFISNGGNNIISLPAADLTIVGITFDDNYLSIPLGPGKNAIIPHMGQGGPRILPVHFTPGTNQITVFTPTSGAVVVLYYGTPLPGSINLTDLTGVVVSASPSAAGSGSVNVTFPKAGTITGYSGYVTASYCQFTWNTSTGKVLTIYDEATEQLGTQNITPLSIATGGSFTLDYNAAAALSFYVIFYYK